MIAIHQRQATHPWTGEEGYHSLDLLGDSEGQLKQIVRGLQKTGFTLWILGHTTDDIKRSGAYLFRKQVTKKQRRYLNNKAQKPPLSPP